MVLLNVPNEEINAERKRIYDISDKLDLDYDVVLTPVFQSYPLFQGVQPILGYCVGAKTWKRFKEVFKFTIIFALILGTVLAAICYVFSNQIVSAFLTDQTAFSYAVQFARILLSTSFLFGVFYVLVNALQAMGAATPALLISMSRQGIIFIPALFILQAVVGMTGLVWAQPVADVLSILIAAILFGKTMKKMQII